MIRRLFVPLVLASLTLLAFLSAAQSTHPAGEGGGRGTDAGRVPLATTSISYQGKLDEGGSAADGLYDFIFSLFDAEPAGTGTLVATVTVEDHPVVAGLFSVELDFGDVYDGTPLWLEVAVRPGAAGDPHTILTPRTALLPAPFAHFATRTEDAGGGSGAWLLSGNGATTPGTHFLGTTDDQPLQFRVNGARALLLEPDATSPNLVGGYGGNMVGAGVSGAVIGGGGYDLAINVVSADFGVIGGGSNNQVSGYAGTVPGGQNNHASGAYSFAAGASNHSSGNYAGVSSGENNHAAAAHAVVGGGYGNAALGPYAAIGGGAQISVSAAFGAAGGGRDQRVEGMAAAIGGGEGNAAYGGHAAIGGGQGNFITATFGTIAGGGPTDIANPTTTNNRVVDDYGVIGGGGGNVAGSVDGDTGNATFTAVGGGANNQAGAPYAFIGGGENNLVSGQAALVCGGANNVAGGSYASIAGGSGQATAANYAAVGGGRSNQVEEVYGTAAGGYANVVSGAAGAILGGTNNSVTGTQAAIGGGSGNLAAATFASIGGGSGNSASGYAAAVGGGEDNVCSAPYATIGGGSSHMASGSFSTIGGGEANSAQAGYATVGGGSGNSAQGAGSVVPGGLGNRASGNFSFAAGRSASAGFDGSFVWNSADGGMNSSGPDQFIIGAAGGVGVDTNGVGFGRDDFSLEHALTVRGDAYLRNRIPVQVGVLSGYTQTLDAPSAVFALGDEVYVTSFSTNTLTVVDVVNPLQPRLIGVTTSNLSGPVDVQVAGQRAYVASYLNNRLVVFDVADPANLDSLGSITTESAPRAIYVAGKYLYAAQSGEFVVYDISDPAEILQLSKMSSYIDNPSDLHVAGSNAYVTSQDNNRLVIFDISNPYDIVYKGHNDTFLDGPVAVQVIGNYAYVLSGNNNYFVAYDVSDSRNLKLADAVQIPHNRPVSLWVSREYAYIASEGEPETLAGSGISIYDVGNPRVFRYHDRIELSATGEKPVAIAGNADRLFVANEGHDTLSIYEVDSLLAPVVLAGEMQTDHLDVRANAVVNNDLAVGGGLHVGPGGALVEGELSVLGEKNNYLLGALSIGAVGSTPGFGEPQFVYPTHQLDVSGEARFRVNNHNNLVLRSPNAGGDEDAYIDFIADRQTTVVTPTARIAFDATDPLTTTTGISFHTRGPADATMVSRVRISPQGDLLPAFDNRYSLGDGDSRWQAVFAVNGVIQTSDGRLKENISPLPYGLAQVQALQPVAFAWKDSSSTERHLGFIAQDVVQVLPEVVQAGGGKEGVLGMNYAEIVPVLVQAVQEQQVEINRQAGQIARLEARLSALEGRAGTKAPPLGWIVVIGLLAGSTWHARRRHREMEKPS